MIESDFPEFAEKWSLACRASANSKIPDPDIVQDAFDMLDAYPINTVLAAIKQHRRVNKFSPVPADIINIIDTATGSGYVGADEAWSLCPMSPAQTCVWTQYIAEAFLSASDLLDNNQDVAARMAFKSAYQRITDQARIRGHPQQWQVSMGDDPAGREAPVRQAVMLGRISEARATALLPHRGQPTMTFKALISRVEQKNTVTCTQSTRDHLAALKLKIRQAGSNAQDRDKQARALYARNEQARKNRLAEQLDLLAATPVIPTPEKM